MRRLTNQALTRVFRYVYHDQIINIFNKNVSYIITKYVPYMMLYKNDQNYISAENIRFERM